MISRLYRDTRTQTPRANIVFANRAIQIQANDLKVRHMADFSFNITVAYLITDHWFLYTKNTTTCHKFFLWLYRKKGP